MENYFKCVVMENYNILANECVGGFSQNASSVVVLSWGAPAVSLNLLISLLLMSMKWNMRLML